MRHDGYSSPDHQMEHLHGMEGSATAMVEDRENQEGMRTSHSKDEAQIVNMSHGGSKPPSNRRSDQNVMPI